jgi:uncharacterized membrane protein YdbT with pleckstrin-like domain
MPKNYLISLLGEGEQILLVARQHWFTLVSAILLEIVLILIGIAAVAVGLVFSPAIPFLLIPLLIVGALFIIVPLFTMVRDLLIWWNKQYVVTNRRVMQLSGIINKNVIDSSLEKVNDIKMEQSVFGRLFGYGDIEILTASELGVNLFRRIGDPIRFKTALLNAKAKLERGEEEEFRPEDIPAMIANLDQLRQKGILTEEEFQKKKAELLAKM